MMPRANSAKANGPATGARASAAWEAVWMSFTPWALRVAAVLIMIARAMRLEKAMPTKVSIRIRAKAPRACAGASVRALASASLSTSSTSSAACQKKR